MNGPKSAIDKMKEGMNSCCSEVLECQDEDLAEKVNDLMHKAMMPLISLHADALKGRLETIRSKEKGIWFILAHIDDSHIQMGSYGDLDDIPISYSSIKMTPNVERVFPKVKEMTEGPKDNILHLVVTVKGKSYEGTVSL